MNSNHTAGHRQLTVHASVIPESVQFQITRCFCHRQLTVYASVIPESVQFLIIRCYCHRQLTMHASVIPEPVQFLITTDNVRLNESAIPEPVTFLITWCHCHGQEAKPSAHCMYVVRHATQKAKQPWGYHLVNYSLH